jgi:hypothetical protein
MRSHRLDNRVAHKSTGGVLPWTPEPVDPVGNPVPLTPNTVALPTHSFGARRPPLGQGEVRKKLRARNLTPNPFPSGKGNQS